MFSFLAKKLTNIYNSLTSKFLSLFSKKIDQNVILELKKILIESDVGVHVTNKIISEVEKQYQSGNLKEGEELKSLLQKILNDILERNKCNIINHKIFLLVGINGSGKTTFAAKLANKYKNEGKKVLLVAGDTFRAAATEQLNQWAGKVGADIVIGKADQDPASVVFEGCQKYLNNNFDVLIIDTAGRLQTKSNLMQELTKLKKVITKNLGNTEVCTLLTVDSMLGQNSFEQAKIFNEATNLNGIILTKLDGTGKGGIVFNISQELNLPVAFISYGENIEDMALFDSKKFVHDILSE